MTTQQRFGDRTRDQQDGTETHLWDEIEYVSDAGAILKVKGTGTQDEEVTLLNSGYGFNLPSNTDTEVTLFAAGSDTNNKYGIPHIPPTKQRPWKSGTGGIQHPNDPDKAVEFGDKNTHLTDAIVALGLAGILEVNNGTVYIRGDLVVSGSSSATNRLGAIPAGGATPVPGFDPN